MDEKNNTIQVDPSFHCPPMEIKNKDGETTFLITEDGEVHYSFEGEMKVCSDCGDIAIAFAQACKSLVLLYQELQPQE